MKDVETKIGAVAEKFCGDNDGIKPAKPCANCSCGLREIYEASQEKEAAEAKAQPAESSCGKCYLGDAFRCAACPFRGQPAFEPGDKLKLATSETLVPSGTGQVEGVKMKEEGTKVVLEL